MCNISQLVIMRLVLIFCFTALICNDQLPYQVFAQNINYFGVAYSPYVKPNGTPWNAYSIEEIKRMLNIILKNHNAISTYGMGVGWYNVDKPWDQADANCLIARAAAQINRDSNAVRLSVSQGVNQHENGREQQKEIDNAFSAAQEANNIRRGTVWGLVFTNEYIRNQERGRKVLDMIRNYKQRANQMGLRVGTRVEICGQIWGGEYQQILIEIAKASDFIMCNIYPSHTTDMNVAVKQVSDGYYSARDGFWRYNRNLEVIIGETGWATQGKTFNNPPQNNNVENMKNFWNRMKQWSNSNQVKVQMFEAFDEPWKTGDEGEKHFGWWKRADDNSDSYIEKATGRRV